MRSQVYDFQAPQCCSPCYNRKSPQPYLNNQELARDLLPQKRILFPLKTKDCSLKTELELPVTMPIFRNQRTVLLLQQPMQMEIALPKAIQLESC